MFAIFSNNFLHIFQPLSVLFLINKTVFPWDFCRITMYISFHFSKVYIEFIKHLGTFFNESQQVFSRFSSIQFYFLHFSIINYIIVLLNIFSISIRWKKSNKYSLRYIMKCKKYIWYNIINNIIINKWIKFLNISSSLLFSTNATPNTCFKQEIYFKLGLIIIISRKHTNVSN